METSSKLFLQSWDFIPKGESLSLGALANKFSESTSRESDPLGFYFWPRNFSLLRHPEGALATIYALSLIRPGWSSAESSEKLLDHILEICKKNMFQGKWLLVGETLQQDLYTRGNHGILSIIIKDMTPESYFGNFLPKVFQAIRNMQIIVPKIPHTVTGKERFRGVKRKSSRRGYRDKGTRRPDHKWLPGTDFSLVEKEQQFLEKFGHLLTVKRPPSQYYFETLRDRTQDSLISKDKEETS